MLFRKQNAIAGRNMKVRSMRLGLGRVDQLHTSLLSVGVHFNLGLGSQDHAESSSTNLHTLNLVARALSSRLQAHSEVAGGFDMKVIKPAWVTHKGQCHCPSRCH